MPVKKKKTKAKKVTAKKVRKKRASRVLAAEIANGAAQALADIILGAAARFPSRAEAVVAQTAPSDSSEIAVTKQVDSKFYVTKQFRSKSQDVGEPEEAQGTIEVHRFGTEPARVMVEYGLTMNMGNYESARLSVAVTVPCYREEVDAAHTYASKWAGDRLAEEVSKVKGTPDKTIGPDATGGSPNKLF